MKRIIQRALLLLIAPIVMSGCGPELSAVAYDKIDAAADPIQTPCIVQRTGTLSVKGGDLMITPMAIYKIAAVVKGKKRYYLDQGAAIAPFDLALAWGRLIEPQMDRYISYSQSGRWYYYTYRKGSPLDGGYIASHSANHHIIPANYNLFRAVRSIHANDTVLLEGYLVNVDGTIKGGKFYWHSSLSRSDTGGGACELFYVQKIRIGRRIYQ